MSHKVSQSFKKKEQRQRTYVKFVLSYLKV